MELVIEAEPPVTEFGVYVDLAAVEQILFNLVDNACKYAASAADRRIHVCVARTDASAHDHRARSWPRYRGGRSTPAVQTVQQIRPNRRPAPHPASDSDSPSANAWPGAWGDNCTSTPPTHQAHPLFSLCRWAEDQQF